MTFLKHIWGIMIWMLIFSPEPVLSEQIDYARCLDCHEGIEAMDDNHRFSCATCHVFPEKRRDVLHTHDDVIGHPAALSTVGVFCGSCHEKEIKRLSQSLHWTLAGLIHQTRFLWGAQPDPSARYSAAPHERLSALPKPSTEMTSPAALVDDLLQRRCLSCHIGAPAVQKRGYFRGQGCAACHVVYDNDGRYKGNDSCLKGKDGYPARHRFAAKIPTQQCQHCHNGPYVGGDFSGFFQHDYHASYRTPITNGYLPETRYLMDHHRLKPDIHFERGMDCVDCHGQSDVMGRGVLSEHSRQAVSVRCRHCHDTSRDRVLAHHIPGMENVHCLGCHGAWGCMDYGMSVLRDDREDLSRWAPWRLQGHASVAELFDNTGKYLGRPQGQPGPWMQGWRFRRWEYLTLGKDDEGRIVPMRPRYQYAVTYVDVDGNVVLDSVIPERGDGKGRGWAFMPYFPHTVARRGRSCEGCHGEPLAAGKGLWKGQGEDLSLTRPVLPVYDSMALLSEPEAQTLLKKTKQYRLWRFRTLWQDYDGQKER